MKLLPPGTHPHLERFECSEVRGVEDDVPRNTAHSVKNEPTGEVVDCYEAEVPNQNAIGVCREGMTEGGWSTSLTFDAPLQPTKVRRPEVDQNIHHEDGIDGEIDAANNGGYVSFSMLINRRSARTLGLIIL